MVASITWPAGEMLSGTDIKGSIGKQYGADRVLLLQPDRQVDAPGPEVGVKLRIVKGRDGTERITIPLRFNHTEYTFREETQATPLKARNRELKAGGAGKIDPMAGLDEE
jgi:hypothetical protein